MSFDEDNISEIIRRILDLEQEKGRPLYPVEVADTYNVSIEDSKKILNLLDRMGIVNGMYKATSFARALQQMPKEG